MSPILRLSAWWLMLCGRLRAARSDEAGGGVVENTVLRGIYIGAAILVSAGIVAAIVTHAAAIEHAIAGAGS